MFQGYNYSLNSGKSFSFITFHTAALVRMKSWYTGMVNSSSSTLWENFPASGTPNHSWAGGPLTLFGRFIAGVAPDSAGFSGYHILPQLNYLKTVTRTVDSHFNTVVPSIRFLQSEKGLRIEPARRSPCRVTILDFCGRVVFRTSAAEGNAIMIPNASIGRELRIVRITGGTQNLVKVVVNK